VTLNRRSLTVIVTLAKSIQDEFNAAGNSQFLEDPVDIVPYRMFLYLELLGNFAVLQAVGDEMNHIFLASRQERHSVGIGQLDWFRASQSAYEMLDILIAGPDLSFVDHPNAFGESLQGVRAIKNTTRSATKSVDDTLRFGGLQKHDGGDVLRILQPLKDLDAGLRAVLQFFADQRHVGFARCQPADDFLRTSRIVSTEKPFRPCANAFLNNSPVMLSAVTMSTEMRSLDRRRDWGTRLPPTL
jgi:hypothetical protein